MREIKPRRQDRAEQSAEDRAGTELLLQQLLKDRGSSTGAGI